MQHTGIQTFKVGHHLFDFAESPIVMGILNVTPDSFYSASRVGLESIVEKAIKMVGDGASILDIGGYSTRPMAAEISVDEELERVVPAITAIKKALPASIISIDTFRYEVAKEAIEAGALLVNDVSGGSPDLLAYVASNKIPYVLMHNRGNPSTMQSLTHYNDLLFDIVQELLPTLAYLHQQGHYEIVIDPGFGFAKTISQNYCLLQNLEQFQFLMGHPLLVGLSRKSMAYKPLGILPEAALNATTVLHTLALIKGAKVLRVHDVAEAYQAIRVWNMFKNA